MDNYSNRCLKISSPVPLKGRVPSRPVRIRSRALTTTLYARLFLADLFIHGIGGGKYDQLTNEIAQKFYGAELPDYLVLSATLLLPFEREGDIAGRCCALRAPAAMHMRAP